YWNRRWSKDQFSLFKNKNREKKRPIKLKLRVELIVFQYLRVGLFPRHSFLMLRKLFMLFALRKAVMMKFTCQFRPVI
ncbi:IS5/IS1182 family transposase, partial [Lactobacillus helveticus]|nr:IS5/IS1182 family transposase [Lactobacillus helveticus]